MLEREARRALYLRWRPQTFAQVVGQEHVTRTLRNAVRGNRLAHAYLLCGPRGTGKTSLARILYRAANCTQPLDGEPCGSCPTCQAALAGRAIDLVEIDAASNRGIDDIRQLRERVAYAPSEGRFRVYIIDEAHELTAPAWDAFLKTLEEPPAHTIFVLATTEAHKVPPTIVSRCQRFDLRRIGLSAIREQLAHVAEQEGVELEPAVLDTLARMARGGLRDALSLLDQLHAYAGEHVDIAAARGMLGMASLDSVRSFIESVQSSDATGALGTLADLIEEGTDLRQFVTEVVAYLRGLLLARAGGAAVLGDSFTSDDLAWLRQHGPLWPSERLLELTKSLADGLARLKDPVQLGLHVELAVLDAAGDGASGRRGDRETGRRGDGETGGRGDGEKGREGEREWSEPDEEEQPLVPGAPFGTSDHPPATSEEPPVVPPSVPPPVPPSPRPPVTSAPVTSAPLATLRERWPQVMEALRGRDGVVAAMLEAAQLDELRDDEVCLAFGYTFHLKQVSELKNRRLVEDVIGEAVGRTVRVSCVHRPPTGKRLSEDEVADELDRLIAEDPVIRRAVDLWGRNLTIVE